MGILWCGKLRLSAAVRCSVNLGILDFPIAAELLALLRAAVRALIDYWSWVASSYQGYAL